MAPYTHQPYTNLGTQSTLSEHALATGDNSYPVEKVTRPRANVTDVSSLDRLPLIVENQTPVMSFFVSSRHQYRELEASLENDRAFFVGVREIAFTREQYSIAADTPLYVDNLTDWKNVRRNDFIEQD
jgi:hypothetical protein